MRHQHSQFRPVKAFVGVAMAASLCGASPQGERDRRETPQPRVPATEGSRPNPMPRAGDGGGARPVGPRTVDMESRPRATSREGEGVARPVGPRRVEMEPRPDPARVDLYPGTKVVIPPAWNRCTTLPDMGYWRRRDLMAEIQGLSRRGFIPVTPLGDTVEALTDYVQMPAGWRAYGISVPVGGTIQIEVQHPKTAWFRLMLVDKWGKPGPGMLQAAMAHQPVLVTYKNPGKEATAIYVIVDDPAWWSDAKNPYTLAVRRDWDPAKTDLSQVKMVAGLWGASPSVSAQFRGPSLTGPRVFPH